MKLKAVVKDINDVPAEYHALYVERNGQWELQVEGMKTEADVERVRAGLVAEREAHKETKQKLNAFNGLDPEEVVSKLDRIEELELAAKGKLDDKQIDELVETRIRSRLAPLEREKQTLADKLAESTVQIQSYEQKERQRTIHDAVRSAATKAKLVDTAIEDALLLAERVFEITDDGVVSAKDGVGATPGSRPEDWFAEMQSKRPHWWGPSSGMGGKGGGGGGGGGNPWTAANWNLTEQGRIYKESPARAEQLAKAAGTTIGGRKPDK